MIRVEHAGAVRRHGSAARHLNGHVKVIAHQNVRDWMSAIPSPDGRHIALTLTSTVSNVWMLKGS